MGGRVEELNEGQSGHGGSARHRHQRAPREEEQEDQADLNEGQQGEGIAQAHQLGSEQCEGRRVGEIDVSGMHVLDIAVEHLAGQKPVGYMGVGALIGRMPEPVMECDQDPGRETRHDHEGEYLPVAGPGIPAPVSGRDASE